VDNEHSGERATQIEAWRSRPEDLTATFSLSACERIEGHELDPVRAARTPLRTAFRHERGMDVAVSARISEPEPHKWSPTARYKLTEPWSLRYSSRAALHDGQMSGTSSVHLPTAPEFRITVPKRVGGTARSGSRELRLNATPRDTDDELL
jgi:hypothetical protein